LVVCEGGANVALISQNGVNVALVVCEEGAFAIVTADCLVPYVITDVALVVCEEGAHAALVVLEVLSFFTGGCDNPVLDTHIFSNSNLLR